MSGRRAAWDFQPGGALLGRHMAAAADATIDVRRDAVTVDRAAGEETLTRNRLRRELHRLVVGRRYRRVAPDVPQVLVMHPHTWEDLALEPPGAGLDDMPGDQRTFRGTPILEDRRQPEHVVEVRWT